MININKKIKHLIFISSLSALFVGGYCTESYALDSIGTYENDNSALKYSGSWINLDSNNYSGGSVAFTRKASSSVDFSFKGSSIDIYGTQAASYGSASVFIDDQQVGTINSYRKTTLYNSLLFSKSDLNDGEHTLKIVLEKDKPENSTGIDFALDKIVVNDPKSILTTGTYQENHPFLRYSGKWAQVKSNDYNEGTTMVSKQPGSSVSFSFTGTSFDIYGTKAPEYGIASIKIDNEPETLVDSYDKYNLYNKLLLHKDGLANKVHTVTITALGENNKKATGTDFSIDKICINSTDKVLTSGIYQEDNDALNYSGTWLNYNSENCNNGAIKIAKVPGSELKFTFSGDSFELYGLQCNQYGTAKLYIDGKLTQVINGKSTTTKYDSLIYQSKKLENGIHNVNIVSEELPDTGKSEFAIDRIAIYNSDNLLTTGVYENDCPALEYSDNWINFTSPNYSCGNISLSKEANSTVNFKFSGNALRIYGNKCNSYGQATVSIDGNVVGTIDAYNTDSLYNKILFETEGLNDGIHFVTITTTGTKNEKSRSIDFSIDKIVINNPENILGSGYYEDTADDIEYSGQWVPYYSNNYSNGAIMISKIADSSFQFTFTGTSIELYAPKYRGYGLISINIDGKSYGTFDSYSAITVYNSLIYKNDNLSEGNHKIIVTLTGDKNENSSGIDFALDRIVVK